MMKKIMYKLNDLSDEDSIDDKTKQIKYFESSEDESNSDSSEEEKTDDDKQAILSQFMDIDNEKISENNVE